jgi:ABC-type uncharacterized transport system permease subunit
VSERSAVSDPSAVSERPAFSRSAFPAMTTGRWALSGLAVLLAAATPLVMTDQYVLGVMITTLILLVLNISWNFVLGVAGVWNFGQLALYALGGYGAGIIMLHSSVSPWLALLAGGLVAMIAAILLSFPTLRLYGIYTSLLTFAFAEVIQYVILNDGSGLTGGSFGLPIVPGLYSSLSLAAAANAYYWTTLAVVVASTLVLAAIGHSRLGIALRGIRDAPAYAAARGVNPLRYRILAFAISGRHRRRPVCQLRPEHLAVGDGADADERLRHHARDRRPGHGDRADSRHHCRADRRDVAGDPSQRGIHDPRALPARRRCRRT